MKPLKILPVIDTNRIGGPGKGLISLVKNLETTCDIPGVVTFDRSGSAKSDFISALKKNCIHPIVIYEKQMFDPSSVFSLFRIIKKYQPDIIQTHGYKASFYLSFLRWFYSEQKWVAWVHGWTAENIKVKLYHFIEKLSLLFADSVVCVSNSLSYKLFGVNGKTVVIPNGIDAEYCDVDSAWGDELRKKLGIVSHHVIAVIGRFSSEKGQDRVLAIAEKLLTKRNDFVFLLIGEGPEKKAIQENIFKKGLSSHIKLLPYESDIRPYYLLADICLLPSRKEGMPNVVLEAMSLNCVVAAFEVGGVSEILKNRVDGVIVEQGNIHLMADALDQLLSDRTAAKKLAEHGRRKIMKTFLNTKRAERVYNLYNRILNGRKCK